MVHTVMKKFAVKEIVTLRGDEEEFKSPEGENQEIFETKSWNPFTFAVAYKKIEIVRYFIHTTTQAMGIPVRHVCKGDQGENPVQQELFAAILAIKVGNYEALSEIWSCLHAWEFRHLMEISKIILAMKDVRAFTEILNAFATGVILCSLPIE